MSRPTTLGGDNIELSNVERRDGNPFRSNDQVYQVQYSQDPGPQYAQQDRSASPVSPTTSFFMKYGFSRNAAARLIIAMKYLPIALLVILFMYLVLYNYTKKDDKDQKEIITFNTLYMRPEKYPYIMWHTAAPWRRRKSDRALQCTIGTKKVYCATSTWRSTRIPDAYLFYGPWMNFSDLPLPRKHQTIWGLFTDETPKTNLELFQEKSLNLFNYSSTFSRFSNVPITLTWMMSDLEELTQKMLWVPTKVKNRKLGDFAAVIYMQSTCDVSIERDNYVRELQKYIKIDSYGKCVNDIRLKFYHPLQFEDQDDVTLGYNELKTFEHLGRYKFMIIIDSEVCRDYVPEKVWTALRLGIVPIYFGSPTIRVWLPNPKSAVLIEDYPTPKALADHLNILLQNDSAYEEYLLHKTKGVISNKRLYSEFLFRPYQINILESINEFECYVCTKLHLKMNECGERKKIDIMTKEEYNCSQSMSALTLSPTSNFTQLAEIEQVKSNEDIIYNTSISTNFSVQT